MGTAEPHKLGFIAQIIPLIVGASVLDCPRGFVQICGFFGRPRTGKEDRASGGRGEKITAKSPWFKPFGAFFIQPFPHFVGPLPCLGTALKVAFLKYNLWWIFWTVEDACPYNLNPKSHLQTTIYRAN